MTSGHLIFMGLLHDKILPMGENRRKKYGPQTVAEDPLERFSFEEHLGLRVGRPESVT